MISNVIVYRIIYMVAAIIIFFLSYTDTWVSVPGFRRNRGFLFFAVSVCMGLFAAVRSYDIQDTLAYLDAYEKLGPPQAYLGALWKIGGRTYGLETGFIFFMAVCKQLAMSFRVFLFTVAFINSFLLLNAVYQICLISAYKNDFFFIRALKIESKNYPRLNQTINAIEIKNIIAVFFSFFAFHYCCIAIRAGLSIALCFIALYFLLKNQKLISLLFLYFAARVHSMALLFSIVLVSVYLQQNNKINQKASQISAIRLFVVFCLLSLALNLSSHIIDGVTALLSKMTGNLTISGFSGYLADLDKNVGLKDWLTVGVIGTSLLIWTNKTSNAMTKLIILGLFVTSFLYPIRAINRAADYFYCLLMPALVLYKERWKSNNRSLYLNYLLLPLLLGVQMAYTI